MSAKDGSCADFARRFCFCCVSATKRIRGGCKPDPKGTHKILPRPSSTILDVLLLLLSLFWVDVGEVALGEILKGGSCSALRLGSCSGFLGGNELSLAGKA